MAAAAKAVLTTASRVVCAHGGSVALSSRQQKLTVDHHPVLLTTDLLGASISRCTNVGPNLTPCSVVTSVTSGASACLSVDGVPVLTESAVGLTNAVPPLPILWQVGSAGQTKLRA
jgi:hypothetical protein